MIKFRIYLQLEEFDTETGDGYIIDDLPMPIIAETRSIESANTFITEFMDPLDVIRCTPRTIKEIGPDI